MAKDHGSSVKHNKQYEGLRNKGSGGNRAQKAAAGRKGGKKSGG